MSNIEKLVVLLIVFVFNTSVLCHEIAIEGYYWREYTGVIPSDALPGGSDHNGNPIYIGQILHRDKLLPTKIYLNDNKGYYGLYNREYSGTNNMKILCSQHPEKFMWVQTKNDEIHLLTGQHIVVGGYGSGYTMYVGRAFYKLETAVGKVITGRRSHDGLYVTHDGKEIHLLSFEILTYNPNATTPSTV